jgi:hypothetical protein
MRQEERLDSNRGLSIQEYGIKSNCEMKSVPSGGSARRVLSVAAQGIGT